MIKRDCRMPISIECYRPNFVLRNCDPLKYVPALPIHIMKVLYYMNLVKFLDLDIQKSKKI